MLVRLAPHPDSPAGPATGLAVALERPARNLLWLRYEVEGDIDRLVLPAPGAPARADELWTHTCFEAFARGGEAGGYCEFNFSPSGRWAAYAFDAYRSGMRVLDMATPSIRCDAGRDYMALEAVVEWPVAFSDAPARLGLSAIIEAVDGAKTYWALTHPPGAPDFHHPDCFALQLPAGGPP